MAPVSWRDVYALLDEHRRESREDHQKINDRLTALEGQDLLRRGQREGEKRIFGMARSTVAVIVSVAGAVVAIFRP